MLDVSIRGDDALIIKLSVDLQEAVLPATVAIAAEIEHRLAPYPAATEANSSANSRWYERGYGPRWRLKDGGVGGKKTSEMLGRRWERRRIALGTVLENMASYSRFVHSKAFQARFHGQRGWRVEKDVIQEMQADGTIKREVLYAIKRVFG